VSACKERAEQAEVRSKMSKFQRQLEVKVRARAHGDVVEIEGIIGIVETEDVIGVVEIKAAVDVVEQHMKKWLGAGLKRWFHASCVTLMKWLSGMLKRCGEGGRGE
jgi:hypothetical protein